VRADRHDRGGQPLRRTRRLLQALLTARPSHGCSRSWPSATSLEGLFPGIRGFCRENCIFQPSDPDRGRLCAVLPVA
jgi:hypothetical protein